MTWDIEKANRAMVKTQETEHSLEFKHKFTHGKNHTENSIQYQNESDKKQLGLKTQTSIAKAESFNIKHSQTNDLND